MKDLLLKDVLHVWWIPYRQVRIISTLSLSERERVERLRGAELQYKYAYFRMALREILAKYTSFTSSQIIFDVERFGKPKMIPGEVQFNLSHSGDYGVCAISLTQPVGIDCEKLRELNDLKDIAKLVFTAGELGQLRDVCNEERADFFFRIWTSKEAILKGMGTGLTFPADKIHVGDFASCYSKKVEVAGYGAWYVSTIDAPEGYSAAVATPNCLKSVVTFEFQSADM